MNKEMQQKLMYSPEFRDAMDQYLNGLHIRKCTIVFIRFGLIGYWIKQI